MNKVESALTDIFMVFVSTCIAQIAVYGANVMNLGASQWKAITGAGVASVIAFLVQWFNTHNDRYGLGSTSVKETTPLIAPPEGDQK
jgi:hypothetical protein